MEYTKFVFSSKFPCLVFCDKVFVGFVNRQSTCKIKVESGVAKQIEVFPTSTRETIYFIPFAYALETSNPKPTSNIKIYNLLDGNFEIEIAPHLEIHMPQSFQKIFEQTKNNTTICVQASNVCKIILEDKNNKIEFCPKHILSDIVCKTFDYMQTTFFILCAKTTDERQYLFVVNLQNIEYCIQKIVDDIKFDLPQITTISFVKDCFEHAIINKYELASIGLKRLESYSSRNKLSFNPVSKNTALAFFECIKVRDYELCRTFMTKNLSGLLSNEHLKHFFPRFDQIKLCPQRDYAMLIGEKVEYYKLDIIDGKIDNIELV